MKSPLQVLSSLPLLLSTFVCVTCVSFVCLFSFSLHCLYYFLHLFVCLLPVFRLFVCSGFFLVVSTTYAIFIFQFYVSLARTLNLNRRDAELKVKVEARSGKRGRPGERSDKNIVDSRKRKAKAVGDQTGGRSKSYSRWVVKPTWPEFIAYILTTKRSTDVSS